MNEFIYKLKQQLEKPLPGQEAQFRMAPVFRKRMNEDEVRAIHYKQSAVMILLCENENDDFFIPLTERMDYKGAHSGQISLPGGKFEPNDENLQATAIRECCEEIGVKDLEVLGALTHLYIPVSNFFVQPFVGFCKTKNPDIIIQQREVKSVLKLSIDTLLDDKLVKTGSVEVVKSLRTETPYFDIQNKIVWGATAMMLNELKEILKIIS
ncbi:MAG: CoA pyrophosphatase [Bacteroidetes bacterium]|nr:CoA pyrophosphatase [Bacteroidota bacterium]